MLRKFMFVFAASAALLAQAPAKKASALDKQTMEVWIRHLFVWPSPIEVTVEDPKPGPLAGFYEVKIRGVSGAQMQEETFYVSKDGQKIVRGSVFDIAQNPFKPDLDKIKTELRPGFGTPGAPVVIAEFSDFECPFCKEEAKTLRDNIVKTYPNEVRVYFFDFPLESLHPWAKAASMAGRCIFRQSPSAFWQFHDWIFDHQGDVTADNLKPKVLEFAQGKDIDAAQLSSCIDTKATEADVNATMQMGRDLAINQTPTIFVNGRRLGGAMQWNDLKTVIDYEIGYQKIAKNAGEDCGCDVRLATPGAPAQPAAAPGLKSGVSKKQ